MALNDFRAIYLPYCLKKQENGKYIVLNRNYKPLGFNSNEEFNYSDFPISSNLKGITEKKAIELSWNDSPDKENIFLYNDGTNPIKSKRNMTEYLKKIESLAKLKSVK